MDPRAHLARVMRHRRVAGVRAALEVYGRAAGGLLANGLAFSALFAAIPTTLLLLGVAGWITGGDAAIRERLRDALVAALPPLADLIDASLRAIGEGAAFTSALGIVGVIWTVGQLFGAAETAFARIFSDQPQRAVVRRTLRGFIVAGLLAVAVIPAVAAVALLAAFDTPADTQRSLARDALGLISAPLLLVLLACAAVVAVYRLLPPHPPRWRAVIPPALTVGALLVALSQAFTFFVPRLVGVAELAGSLASGFVALAWLSLSFQALLLGAAWVQVRDAGAGPRSALLDGPATPAEPGAG